MQLKPVVVRTLGGKKMLKSATLQGVRSQLARGLPGAVLLSVERAMRLSPADSVMLFGVSPATRKRILKDKTRRLDPVVADRAVRLARIFGDAVEHFGDQARATDWLQSTLHALDEQRPLDLLDSDLGTQVVRNLLMQMEYGIHS